MSGQRPEDVVREIAKWHRRGAEFCSQTQQIERHEQYAAALDALLEQVTQDRATMESSERELARLRDGLRDAAEGEGLFASKCRDDADVEGAAIHSYAAATLRALLSASQAQPTADRPAKLGQDREGTA